MIIWLFTYTMWPVNVKKKRFHCSFANYSFFELPEKPPHASVKTFLRYRGVFAKFTCFYKAYFQFASLICAIWAVMETLLVTPCGAQTKYKKCSLHEALVDIVGWMTWMGNMAKILYLGYYFSFTLGVVSAGKHAICDHVHLLKLAKTCNRFLMRAVFLGFTFNAYNECFQDTE